MIKNILIVLSFLLYVPLGVSENLTADDQAVIILVDQSASMKEDSQLKNIKLALEDSIHNFISDWSISVVGFDKGIFPLIPLGKHKYDTLERKMRYIFPSGPSDLSVALEFAQSEFEKKKFLKKKLIIFSDFNMKVDFKKIGSQVDLLKKNGFSLMFVNTMNKGINVLFEFLKTKADSSQASNPTEIQSILLKELNVPPHESIFLTNTSACANKKNIATMNSDKLSQAEKEQFIIKMLNDCLDDIEHALNGHVPQERAIAAGFLSIFSNSPDLSFLDRKNALIKRLDYLLNNQTRMREAFALALLFMNTNESKEIIKKASKSSDPEVTAAIKTAFDSIKQKIKDNNSR